jgi:phosphoglycolate phosphatase
LSDEIHNTRFDIFKKFFLTIYPNEDVSFLLKETLEKFTVLCERAILEVPEVDGAIDTLKTLKNMNKRLFISSLTPEDTLNKIVNKRGLDIYFERVFGSPDPKITHLKNIHNITSIKPSKTIYIGDSNSDLKASIQFGCSYMGIGVDKSIYSHEPTYFFKDYNNFL